jgi:sialate O-acetylesterase
VRPLCALVPGLLLSIPSQAGPAAQVRLAKMFGDHMVLQRDVPLPVWGWAGPGEKVAVRMAGQSGEAVADREGRWSVKIGPFPAGGPHTLAAGPVELRDVLVGDVWICSGQSNKEGLPASPFRTDR